VDCKQIRENIYSIIDNEIDKELLNSIEEHLNHCDACLNLKIFLTKLNFAFKTQLKTLEIDFEQAEKKARSKIKSRLEKVKKNKWNIFIKKYLLPLASSIAIFFLIIYSYFYISNMRFFEEVLLSYKKVISHPSHTGKILNYKKLASLIGQNISQKIKIPNILQQNEIKLEGYCISTIYNKKAMALKLKKNSTSLALFILDKACMNIPGCMKCACPKKKIYYYRFKDFYITTWKKGDSLYIMAGKLSKKELLLLASKFSTL